MKKCTGRNFKPHLFLILLPVELRANPSLTQRGGVKSFNLARLSFLLEAHYEEPIIFTNALHLCQPCSSFAYLLTLFVFVKKIYRHMSVLAAYRMCLLWAIFVFVLAVPWDSVGCLGNGGPGSRWDRNPSHRGSLERQGDRSHYDKWGNHLIWYVVAILIFMYYTWNANSCENKTCTFISMFS